MCFQALRQIEIGNIKRMDIDLRKAEIYIRMTIKSENRTLRLEPQQVMDIHEYLLLTNNHEVKESASLLNAKHLNRNSQQLSDKLKSNPENHSFKNLQQIRASVITNWLKHHDVMTVKYMAGHRFVSSTERYNMANVEELKQKILRVHPMG